MKPTGKSLESFKQESDTYLIYNRSFVILAIYDSRLSASGFHFGCFAQFSNISFGQRPAFADDILEEAYYLCFNK